MTAAILPVAAAELVLRATLLIGAAWAAAAALRRADASASTRHIAWLLGIAALLALPLLWWLAPALRLPILGPEAAVPAPASLPTMSTTVGASDSPAPWGWPEALLVAYAIGAALLLLRIAIFRLMLARLWRDARPALDADWQALTASVSNEMRLSRPVALRIASGPAMPMTWGTLAPKVLLPAEAEAWPADRRRLVLLHELAHVARRDSLSRSAASLACALYWFHPGAWLAARRMRIEQEHAADDRVLDAGAPARSYALSLVHLARGIDAGSRFDHAAAMGGMAQLERRLVSITTQARRERPGAAFLGLSTVTACLFTLIVSAGVPVRATPAVPPPLREESPLSVPAPAKAIARTDAGDRLEPRAPGLGRAETVAPGETRSREMRDGRETARVAVSEQSVPAAPEAARPADEVQAPSAPTAAPPGRANGTRPRPSPIDRPQLAAYGPQLPRSDAGADDSDARIPVLARQRERGESDREARRHPLGIRFGSPGETGGAALNLLNPELTLMISNR